MKKQPDGAPVGIHHSLMRDSKGTSDLLPQHCQDSLQSKQLLLQSNHGNEVEGSSTAHQALIKLKTRTALQDRILSIYRESLFILKDEIALKLPNSTSLGSSTKREKESCVEYVSEGEAQQALNSFAEYDHDRDYSIRSLYLDEDFTRRHAGGSLSAEGTCDEDLAGPRRDFDEESGGQIQGPILCRWLDSEIAAIKENYEEEINTLEEIITALRTLAATTESKKKKKKRPKSSDHINPLRFSQSDDFVVRHVDKT